MALITCPECSKQISDQADACPHCGYKTQHAPTNTPTTKAQGVGFGAKLVMVMAILFAMVIYFAGQGVGNNASGDVKPQPQTPNELMKEQLDQFAAQCVKGYSAACEQEKALSNLLTTSGEQAY